MTTVDLERDVEARLDVVAASLNRTRSWTIEQPILEFLEVQESHLAAIDEGLRDLEEGRTVEHSRVVAWMRSWGTENELPKPECD